MYGQTIVSKISIVQGGSEKILLKTKESIVLTVIFSGSLFIHSTKIKKVVIQINQINKLDLSRMSSITIQL